MPSGHYVTSYNFSGNPTTFVMDAYSYFTKEYSVVLSSQRTRLNELYIFSVAGNKATLMSHYTVGIWNGMAYDNLGRLWVSTVSYSPTNDSNSDIVYSIWDPALKNISAVFSETLEGYTLGGYLYYDFNWNIIYGIYSNGIQGTGVSKYNPTNKNFEVTSPLYDQNLGCESHAFGCSLQSLFTALEVD